MHYFKPFRRVKSTEDVKLRFTKGNELKLTQVELLSFFSLRVYDLVQNVITYAGSICKLSFKFLIISEMFSLFQYYS